MTIRVFIVDDYPLFRAGVRSVLREIHSLELVGEAATGGDALPVLRELEPPPDVVLVDLHLPDRSAIELTRTMIDQPLRDSIRPRVIVISSQEDDDAVVAARRAGAHGYLIKDTSPEELLRAIETVAEGGAVFGPRVAARLSTYFSAVHELPSRMAFPELTDREREILDLLARGHDNRRIARTLVLSEKTVRNHVSRVLTKLQVSKRAEAMVRARDAGLGR
jgi:DNA-binding NarL/FixJ family response regulator